MVASWMNARLQQTVLKMPLVLTLLMTLSVSVPLTSLEMVESVELDAMVRHHTHITYLIMSMNYLS